jgi:hypothetical protein
LHHDSLEGATEAILRDSSLFALRHMDKVEMSIPLHEKGAIESAPSRCWSCVPEERANNLAARKKQLLEEARRLERTRNLFILSDIVVDISPSLCPL